MTQVEFRPFTPQDAEIAPQLFIDALQTVYPDIQSGKWDSDLRDIPNAYQADGGDFLMGEVNGNIVAQGGIHRIDDSTAEMKRVAVSPEAQDGGIGQQLRRALEDRARELGFTKMVLDTTLGQEAARHIYEKGGYVLVDRRLVDHPSGTQYDTFFYEKDLVEPEPAAMNPVIDVETWLQDDDHSIAFVSLNGINRTVMNRGSDITYHVISGTGTMNFPEEARTVKLFPNARITVPRGTVYQDAGNLVMVVTATPPFDREMEEIVK